MPRTYDKKREEARRLYLTGEMDTNAEIAVRLGVKPHTIGTWRREEDWDGLRQKLDRRAAELFSEKIASDRVTLNVRHYRYWELILAKVAETLKEGKVHDLRDLERLTSMIDHAQKGQRLAKGLSLAGETEEAVRARAQTEIHRLIDAFVDAVKEHVGDEQARERIRSTVFQALSHEEDGGAGDEGGSGVH